MEAFRRSRGNMSRSWSSSLSTSAMIDAGANGCGTSHQGTILSGPQELLDVASYAESLHRWPPLEGGTGDGSALKEGYVVYHRDCAECHGPLGLGDQRRVRPRLAGQRYQYLLRQLEETADRMRPGMNVEHVKLISAFSAEERQAVADYLSRLSPNLSSTQEQAPKPP